MSETPAAGPGDDKWAPAMRAALAGDEAAYRRLLEEIGRSVRAMARGAFARARVGDADIEDVVQETLLAIHLKRGTWDGGPRLAPWVNAIARHKIIDAMRRPAVAHVGLGVDLEEADLARAGEDRLEMLRLEADAGAARQGAGAARRGEFQARHGDLR